MNYTRIWKCYKNNIYFKCFKANHFPNTCNAQGGHISFSSAITTLTFTYGFSKKFYSNGRTSLMHFYFISVVFM